MNQFMRIAIGALVGVVIGYAIYRIVGCRTGACPLTANPYVAMIVYGLFGAIVMGSR